MGLRARPALDGARDRRRGDGPSIVLAVGARQGEGVVYPVSELAQRYEAGADIEHRRGAEGKAGESPYVGFPEDREGSSPL